MGSQQPLLSPPPPPGRKRGLHEGKQADGNLGIGSGIRPTPSRGRGDGPGFPVPGEMRIEEQLPPSPLLSMRLQMCRLGNAPAATFFPKGKMPTSEWAAAREGSSLSVVVRSSVMP